MRGLTRRTTVTVAATAGASVLAAGMVVAAGRAAVAETAARVTAAKAPLPPGAATNPKVSLGSVSCVSAGNCTAVGGYNDSSGHQQGLLLTQAVGAWKAAEAPLPAGAAPRPKVSLGSVSCGSAGHCTAVGAYIDSLGNEQGLLLTRTAGTWKAVKAPLPAGAATNPFAGLSSVSCGSAGNCTAVGSYTDRLGNQQGLLLTRTAGTWKAVKAPLPAGAATNQPLVFVFSVRCVSAGNCTAVGGYYDSSGHFQGLLLTQTAGTWKAAKAPMPAGAWPSPLVAFESVSCVSAGHCTAVGSYDDRSFNEQGLLLTQTAGTWAAVKAPLPGGAATNPFAFVGSVSCGSAGNCTAVGAYIDSSGGQPGLLLTQTAGTWKAAKAPLPAGAATNENVLYSVSCVSAGNCTAVGFYGDSSGHVQGVLLTQTAGTWQAAKAPLPAGAAANPFASLRSVSCGSAGNCTAVGDYNDSSGHQQGLLLTQTSPAAAALVPTEAPNLADFPTR